MSWSSPDRGTVGDLTAGVTDPVDLEAEIRALRNREAIANLAIIYARAVDDCDTALVADLFAEDATFDQSGNVARGRSQVVDLLHRSMTGFRMMLHTQDTHLVQLTGARTADGWAAGHAELTTRNTTVVAAYRYQDRYQQDDDGRWRFASRRVGFMYAVPQDQLAGALSSSERIRFPRSEPAPADFPEGIDTFDQRGER